MSHLSAGKAIVEMIPHGQGHGFAVTDDGIVFNTARNVSWMLRFARIGVKPNVGLGQGFRIKRRAYG